MGGETSGMNDEQIEMELTRNRNNKTYEYHFAKRKLTELN